MHPPTSLLEVLGTKTFADAAPIWRRVYPAAPLQAIPRPDLGRHDEVNISLNLSISVDKLAETLGGAA